MSEPTGEEILIVPVFEIQSGFDLLTVGVVNGGFVLKVVVELSEHPLISNPISFIV